MTESVDEFFDDEDFAVQATYTQGATVKFIPVLFDTMSATLDESGLILSSASPKILARTSDTENITDAATFKINDVVYKVLSLGVDDHGIREIMLRR